MGFTHLHQHTHYSLLDGMTTPEEACKIAAANGQTAIALTDHGTCAGYMQFQIAAEKTGIKPLFGIEAYFTEDILQDKEDKKAERFHLIMFARNEQGMENIFKLQKKAWTEGFYYKNRVDWGMLEQHSKGIIATTSCMGGIIAKCIRNGEEARAEAIIDRMVGLFDRTYVELQPWNGVELNNALISIADARGLPLVGTIDCHYPTHNHKELEEVLLCIGMYASFGAKIVNHVKDNWQAAKKINSVIDKMDFLYPDRRLRFYDNDHYIMDEKEVRATFAEAGITRDDVFTNTMEVAEECNVSIKRNQSLLPQYDKNYDSAEFLTDLAQFKLEELGLTTDEYKDRLQEELDVILQLNFSDYFLVVWDLVNWAKNHNILVGAGRGSAAGSLLAYTLGITDVDPIEHNLIFWRFINPDRLDYPDIDLDFEDRYRERVKQYLRERWGAENVAGISTFGGFKAKATVKDAARVFGAPISLMNEVTKHFDDIPTLKAGKNEVLQEFRRDWPEVVQAAEVLYERIRQAGAHPAGVVISNRPLDEICPIETREDKKSETGRVEVVAWDMDDCQKLGLIKMDILGLNNLSVVHDACDAIKERHGKDVMKLSQELDDPRIFEEFSRANTVGVFQTESSAYKHLLLNMGIENFNDLAASNALVRPGALMTQTDTYIKRKHGKEATTYLHPILEPITKETYGTFVYQEQIMETVVKLAGFSWRESDTLRKIIGKKRDSHEFDEWQQKFVEGASQHITVKQATKMWEDFVNFSSYAFNKSHAISYSKLSYQTMWLKVYYPLEYMWALLKNEEDKQPIATYLLEARRMGIKVLPPHVNKSEAQFTLEDDAIRFGLSNVSGVGPSAIKEIMSKRPFSSLDEFRERCKKSIVRILTVEALDKVGAFEGIHNSQYEHNRYYFELLNYPVDLTKETEFESKILPCADFVADENNLGIVKAIVRSTKRMPTYFRVEFEDTTGSFSVFAPQSMMIEPGQFLVALVGKKRLHAYLDVYTMDENKDDALYQFLVNDPLEAHAEAYEHGVGDLDHAKSLVHIIDVARFKTKKGDMMANILVWDGKTLEQLVVFPKSFSKYVFDLKPWKTVLIKPETLKDGGRTINDLIDIEKFYKLKGLK